MLVPWGRNTIICKYSSVTGHRNAKILNSSWLGFFFKLLASHLFAHPFFSQDCEDVRKRIFVTGTCSDRALSNRGDAFRGWR